MNTSLTRFFVTGGTVPSEAPSYILRRADVELYDGLLQGEFCYVLTPRQMGKSSLMVRTAVRLREVKVAVAVVDLTALGHELTAAQWYDSLLVEVAEQLGLEDELDDFCAEHRPLSPLQRWRAAIREIALKWRQQRIVIFIDEINITRSLPFSTDEFFAAIREFYNSRALEPELNRLTFCLLGVATPSDLIRDTRMTPFNIGRRIELTDFTAEEAAPLAAGLIHHQDTKTLREESTKDTKEHEKEHIRQNDPQIDIDLHRFSALVRNASVSEGQTAEGSTAKDFSPSSRLISRILYWTGGHPYLTQRLPRRSLKPSLPRHPTPDTQHPL